MPRASWRDHAWITAIIGGAATAVFFFTVVLPIWTKVEQNNILDLQGQIEDLKKAVDPESADKKKVAELKSANERLISDVERLRFGPPFEGGNPYPKVARLVHVGDPISDVIKVYKDYHPIEKEGWISIKFKGSLFDGAAFYKSVSKNNAGGAVDRILFNISTLRKNPDSGFSEFFDHTNSIASELIETFGQSKSKRIRDGEIIAQCWRDIQGVDIELSPHSLLILRSGSSRPFDCRN